MLYRRGEFQVLLFDRYGNKLYTHTAQTNHEATDMLNMFLQLRPENSGVINRTIVNSKDEDNKWDYIQ